MDYSKIFINGTWMSPLSSKYNPVHNPATGALLASLPSCSKEDVILAIQAAHEARPTWEKLPLTERITRLEALLKSLSSYRDELISTIVSELGSPITFTREVQVDSPIEDFRSFLNFIKEPAFEEKYEGYTLFREAVGVVSCICPWNYPLYQLIQKVVPALLCGNTVVLKPSSLTPLSAYYFAKAAEDVDLPRGVFNLITGLGSTIGHLMASHPLVDMVSFTGSTVVGRAIAEAAASSIKKLALELGGKSPCLVLEGADYPLAVDTVLDSCFYNSGQTCSALTRLFIPRSSRKFFYDLISEKIETYRCGDPAKETTVLGPLSSPTQLKVVKHYIEEGLKEGARLIAPAKSNPLKSDIYFPPCVFFDVTNDMTIAQEEIFGPVLCVIEYDDLETAISECNDSPYGLSACVFGEDKEAIKIAKRIKSGNVHINDSPFASGAPFGGYKQSGIGRENGIHGILEFTELKAVFHR